MSSCCRKQNMAQPGNPRICGNCGTKNSATDQFCSNCGYALDSAPTGSLTVQRPGPTVQSSTNTPASTGGRRITGAFLAGNVLGGRYRVVKMIGKGGFGAVYQARDERFQSKRVVAIKEMSDAQLNPQEKTKAIQDFRNEADLLVELNHPNLPNVSDFFEEAGKAYLAMEFIEGKTLEDKQDEVGGPLDEQLVMDWALQLCTVLHYLHTRPHPIIFRDMKPANVMVTADGQIKLIDFGIARIFKAAGTKDTTLLGSQGYAPLEQYGRGQSDARSDIYALGATLYDLLTKEVPADAPSRRVNPQFFTPPRHMNPNISPATEEIVLKAMADNPQDRYQSAADMYQAIIDSGIVGPGNTMVARGNTMPNMPTVMSMGRSQPLPTQAATVTANTRTTTGTNQVNQVQGQMAAPPFQPTSRPPITPPTGQAGISRRNLLIGGAAVVGVVAAGSLYVALNNNKNNNQAGTPGTTGTINLKFTYSTEKNDWMQQAILKFNSSGTKLGGKSIQVTGNQLGSGDSKEGILNGDLKPVAWSPASTLEINQLNAKWKTKNGKELVATGDLLPKQLVFSPIVFAVWKERSQFLLKKYTTIDWKSIHDAVQLASWSDVGGKSEWGPVKLGQTRPDQSNSGLLSITLIAYSYFNISRNLTVNQIQDPAFLTYFQQIETNVQQYGRSSGTYLQNEIIKRGPPSYDIIPIYENLVLKNQDSAKQLQNQPLLPFYPSVNIISDHPFAILNGDWVQEEDKQAAKAFRDFLLNDDQQRQALLSGFRPASSNINIKDAIKGNPFLNQPPEVQIPTEITNQAQPPNGDVVDALLKLWIEHNNTAQTALSAMPPQHKGLTNHEFIL